MLVDKKIMVSGILMIAVGITITSYLEEATPLGEAGMTADEKLDFLMAERENADYKILSGILIGVGFLLLLISFGARRKRGSGAKKTEKKPTT
uniref:Uncharacterized protein n=1 Tax=uncultured marine crenarchaeote AD1000-202-A2 TaxID=526636 RepID=B3V5W3_9ARCH|nr:hypothetical protein [uncultured marine crenarchaeote AD1000-202-A2]